MLRRTLSAIGSSVDRRDLGGWALVSAGLIIVLLTVLMPAWHDVQALKTQRDTLDRQLADLRGQHARYQRFIQSIRESDPIALERLAWEQLHLKPAGAKSIDPAPWRVEPAGQGHVAGVSTQPRRRVLPSLMQLETSPTAQASPQAAKPYAPPNTRLVRLTTGKHRLGVMAAGLVLLSAGLMVRLRGTESAA